VFTDSGSGPKSGAAAAVTGILSQASGLVRGCPTMTDKSDMRKSNPLVKGRPSSLPRAVSRSVVVPGACLSLVGHERVLGDGRRHVVRLSRT
jgi:hypothetical protein